MASSTDLRVGRRRCAGGLAASLRLLGLLLALAGVLGAPPALAYDDESGEGVVDTLRDLAVEVGKGARKCGGTAPKPGGFWIWNSPNTTRITLGVAGFHPQAPMISRAAAKNLVDELQAYLGRDDAIQLVVTDELGQMLGFAWDLFGSDTGNRASKALNQIHFELGLFAEPLGRKAGLFRAKFTVASMEGDCKSITILDIPDPAPPTVPGGDLIADAARAFFDRIEAPEQIAVLPSVVDGSRVDPGLADKTEATFIDMLRQASEARRASFGKSLPETRILSVRQGEFIAAETEQKTWSAQILVSRGPDGGPLMTVAYSKPGAKPFTVPEQPSAIETAGWSAKDLAPSGAALEPAKPAFVIGTDDFGFKLGMLAKRRAYCVLRALDGEALVLFPNVTTRGQRDNPLRPRPEPYLFPGDFGYPAKFRFPLQKPTNDLVTCFIAATEIDRALEALWFDNSPTTLMAKRKRKLAEGEALPANAAFMAPELAATLMQNMRRIPGMEEHVIRILVVEN